MTPRFSQTCRSGLMFVGVTFASVIAVCQTQIPIRGVDEPASRSTNSTGAQSVGFPEPINTEQDTSSKALPPEQAAQSFRVPEGFRVTVAAAEPDVQNPIAMAWDDRGRLWVAENYTYADRIKKFDLSLRDRVLILEDTDQDGKFDRRTVFTDDVQMLTSLAVGYGGVWLMTPPQLIFIPDSNRDDQPDGEPIVMLDGFTPATDNHHTFANGLKWGPDGWLYGRCGASSPGRVGTPGLPDDQRVPLFGGVWRYHPAFDRLVDRNKEKPSLARQEKASVFEVLCHGTTNPWGMDWNEFGDAFFINTVNGHLWHVIPGAHFRRPHSEDPNPFVYSTIDTHADHYHWDTGKDWTDSRKATGEHDRLGGGHAHSGATIYLGDNWPTTYRGRLLTLNLHGRRVNVERLDREGSGYTGRHEPDILQAADPWFRGIDLSYGPDGAVYILDWSDTGECHEATGVHRTSGRIYRVDYDPANSTNKLKRHGRNLDMHQWSTAELLASHLDPNEWFVRMARLELAARYHGSAPDSESFQETRARLMAQFHSQSDIPIKLRILATLFTLQGVDSTLLNKLLQHPDDYLRATAIRLLADEWPLDTIMGQPHPAAVKTVADHSEQTLKAFVQLAQTDRSSQVRLALASVLQRIPVERRLTLATPLADHPEEIHDHNLPLMIWYGLIPVASSNESDLSALADFASRCQFPVTQQLISRRLAERIDEHPRTIARLLASVNQTPSLRVVLEGLSQGFAGRHKITKPSCWDTVAMAASKSDDKRLQELVRDLSVLFGDGRALEEVQRIALDGKSDLAARRAALQTLIDNRAPERRKICEQLLNVRYLNTTAIRGLTEFDDSSIGEKLARNYRSFFPSDRPAVIDALVSRPTFAEPLLEQIEAGKIPKTDLTAVHARQIRSFGSERLTRKLIDVWGELRDSPAEKQELIARWKSQLTPERLSKANKSQGRALFAKVCGNCHRLYGHGAQIGPDLTGSGRQNLDYVLINLFDPSAAVGADYRLSTVVLQDGRVLNGIIAARTEKMITLQTARDRQTIEQSEVEEIQPSSLSLMPDGLLQTLTNDEVRDLVAYVMSPSQVPLPGDRE